MFANYTEVDVSKISMEPPQTRKIPKQQGTYTVLPINYNYGTEDAPNVSEFYLQMPELKSNGIVSKVKADGGEDKSLLTFFQIGDEKQKEFVEVWKKIFSRIGELMLENRAGCRIPMAVNDLKTLLDFELIKDPMYYPRNKETKAIIPGKSPCMYLKINTVRRTVFSGLNKQTIDWKLLEGTLMDFIPVMHISGIYVGAKCSLQSKLASAVVLSMVDSKSSTRQGSTIEEYVKNNPESVDRFEKEMAKLSLERQDSMSDSTQSYPQIQSIQDQLTTPLATPSRQSTQSSFNGFLSGAPSLSNMPKLS